MMFFSPRQFFAATAIASVSVASVMSAQANTSSNVRALVQNNYDKINAAFIKKDLDTVTSYFTADYVGINAKGERQSLTEFRNYYGSLFQRLKIDITTNKTTIKSITIDPSGARVAAEQITEGKVVGNNKIAIRQTSQSLWTNTAKGWRLKESKVLTDRTTFNGKTFKG